MLDIGSKPEVAAPALAPDAALDREHLFQMTLGDASLEGEVLRLFERQCAMLLARMAGAEPAAIKAMAHTLVGSARGIGAWRVASAARALEDTVDHGGDLAGAIARLATATEETLAVVAEALRVH